MSYGELNGHVTNCLCVVVEKLERSASLYSESVQGHPVCLLLKLLVNIEHLSLETTVGKVK